MSLSLSVVVMMVVAVLPCVRLPVRVFVHVYPPPCLTARNEYRIVHGPSSASFSPDACPNCLRNLCL